MPIKIKAAEKRISTIINALSFNKSIRKIVDNINEKTENYEGDEKTDLISHPGGFIRAFNKRRVGIAEAYIRIAKDLDRNNYQKRLNALKTLTTLSFHAKTLSMPLNTARIQIEIMKEAVKSKDDKRKQLEMAADFSLASYGHEAVIRRFLKELKRAETPEKGKPIKDLDMGWDSHVHDNLSEGRKTPSQLMLDAFIKGLSSVTLAYYDIPPQEILYETKKAGKILGIKANVGIEFSVGEKTVRRHFMFIPKEESKKDPFDFLNDNNLKFSGFINGLHINKEKRKNIITAILNNFNNTDRITINEGYDENSIFALKPIKIEELDKIIQDEQYSRNHLKELIYTKIKTVFKKRVLSLKIQYKLAEQLFDIKKISEWELERLRHSYYKIRKEYSSISPYEIGKTYVSGKQITDYDSFFSAEKDILPNLKSAGGTIVYCHVLEQGFNEAITVIINNYEYIDKIEIINVRDAFTQNPAEIIRLSIFTDILNNGEFFELEKFLNEKNIKFNIDKAKKAFNRYHAKPLIPTAGSAATGWDPNIPGMGFIKESKIPLKFRKDFIKNHYALPAPASFLIATSGKIKLTEQKVISPEHKIYCLGKRGRTFKPNLVGDEENVEYLKIKRVWRYLNPALKNTIRVAIGLIPAYLWIGAGYTAIWFSITFLRNIFVDMFVGASKSFKTWSYKDINFDNATQSLFWTGFSVPILGFIKNNFDIIWPLALSGLFFELSKFFIICMANGIYISTHNKIRNFDNKVIKGNFFRSAIAWPFAAIFSPLGNLANIPSIVQAKFWSDIIGAIIEGTGKISQAAALRKRDLSEILPLLEQEDNIRLPAMLDLLFIWAKRKRGKASLAFLLCGKKGFWGYCKKKKNNEENIKRIKMLINLFNPSLAHFKLIDFILLNYSDNEALILTELINKNMTNFYLWLNKIKRDTK